jgi:hypothetical protein
VLQIEHLPDCLSLFVENDLLTPVLEHSCTALRYAHRHFANKSGNPISEKLGREIIEAKQPPVVTSVPHHVRAAEKLLGVSYESKSSTNKRIRALAIEHQFSKVFLSVSRAKKAKLLKQTKLSAGKSSFAHVMGREQIALLSTLRLGRWEVNGFMHKIGKAASAACAICLVDETSEHLQLVCSRFAVERLSLKLRLQSSFHIDLSLRVALGGVEQLEEDDRKPALQIVYDFLRHVYRTRF